MFKKPHCPVIAIEEHYWDEELAKTYIGGEAGRPGEQSKRLHDLDTLRIKEMDEAGIDIQVLSHGAPSAQKLPAETAAALTRRVNDRLHAVVAGNPTASPPSPRCRPRFRRPPPTSSNAPSKLGFKGAMLHGLANGVFLDDKRFWPIYARAEALDVPIYLHPSLPHADVTEHLLRGLRQGLPDGGAAGLGLYGRDRDACDPAGALRRVRASIRG